MIETRCVTERVPVQKQVTVMERVPVQKQVTVMEKVPVQKQVTVNGEGSGPEAGHCDGDASRFRSRSR